jgi:hypothetical protein
MTAPLADCYPWTELAAREESGTSVTLLWARGTNVLAVSVVDHRNGDAFELVLETDDRPLDVFYHPYAYAAARGLDFPSTVRVQEEMVDV